MQVNDHLLINNIAKDCKHDTTDTRHVSDCAFQVRILYLFTISLCLYLFAERRITETRENAQWVQNQAGVVDGHVAIRDIVEAPARMCRVTRHHGRCIATAGYVAFRDNGKASARVCRVTRHREKGMLLSGMSRYATHRIETIWVCRVSRHRFACDD